MQKVLSIGKTPMFFILLIDLVKTNIQNDICRLCEPNSKLEVCQQCQTKSHDAVGHGQDKCKQCNPDGTETCDLKRGCVCDAKHSGKFCRTASLYTMYCEEDYYESGYTGNFLCAHGKHGKCTVPEKSGPDASVFSCQCVTGYTENMHFPKPNCLQKKYKMSVKKKIYKVDDKDVMAALIITCGASFLMLLTCACCCCCGNRRQSKETIFASDSEIYQLKRKLRSDKRHKRHHNPA